MQKVISVLQGPQFKLKLFLWLVFGALAAEWTGISYLWNVSFESGAFNGKLPALTLFCIDAMGGSIWIFVLFPWFIYAVVSGLRPGLKLENCLVFAASAALFGIFWFFLNLLGLVVLLSRWFSVFLRHGTGSI